LYDDLKTDTAVLQRNYDEKSWIQAKFDSAESMLSSNEISLNNEFLYYVERYLRINDVFTSQDVTYQQLSGSGNFRYLKNVALYKKIADYYNLYSRYQSIDRDFGVIEKGNLSAMEPKLFNVCDLASLDNYNGDNVYNLVMRPGKKLAPIKTDEQSLKYFYIKVAEARFRVNGAKWFISILKLKATELMIDLSNEYHLEGS
jgi:hypothetical protein